MDSRTKLSVGTCNHPQKFHSPGSVDRASEEECRPVICSKSIVFLLFAPIRVHRLCGVHEVLPVLLLIVIVIDPLTVSD